jgi:hypothetical protein
MLLRRLLLLMQHVAWHRLLRQGRFAFTRT